MMKRLGWGIGGKPTSALALPASLTPVGDLLQFGVPKYHGRSAATCHSLEANPEAGAHTNNWTFRLERTSSIGLTIVAPSDAANSSPTTWQSMSSTAAPESPASLIGLVTI
jgi:hypothetical protein